MCGAYVYMYMHICVLVYMYIHTCTRDMLEGEPLSEMRLCVYVCVYVYTHMHM